MPYLPQAVEDLLRQRSVDLEVVAVHDGAGDDGPRFLRERSRRDGRLRVFPGAGEGPASALNQALGHARGAWIGQMEADDRCPRRRFQQLARALESHPTWEGVVSASRLYGNPSSGMARYVDWQNSLATAAQMARARFIEIPALHQTGLYRRQLFERLGQAPFRDQEWPLDIDFWLRLLEQGVPIGKVSRPLYFWRQHPRQSTRTEVDHEQEVLQRCKAHYFARGPAAGRPVDLVSTGSTLERWTRLLDEAGVGSLVPHAWSVRAEPVPPRRPGAVRLFVYGVAVVRVRVGARVPDLDEDDWFAA